MNILLNRIKISSESDAFKPLIKNDIRTSYNHMPKARILVS